MFTAFNSVICRTSSAVDYIVANPITGIVDVLFNNGCSYRYSNVSRRAIVNLINQPNMSLGFWVNDNCIDKRRVKFEQRYSLAV